MKNGCEAGRAARALDPLFPSEWLRLGETPGVQCPVIKLKAASQWQRMVLWREMGVRGCHSDPACVGEGEGLVFWSSATGAGRQKSSPYC